MKVVALSWGAVSIAIVFVCVILSSISMSLWFLMALLGDGSGEYSVGYYNSLVATIPIEQSLPHVPSSYNRLVYKKGPQGEYIAGIPKVRNQFSVMQDLREQQWEVRRLGWIVVASNTGSPMSSPYKRVVGAIGKTLHTLILKRLPLYPIAIVQDESKSTDAFSAYVEESRKGIHAVINTDSSRFIRRKMYRSDTNTALGESSYVALHSDVLHFTPSGVREALERKVSDSLAFKKTHPRIIESFLQHGSGAVLYEGDLFAVGLLSSDTNVATQIEAWMHEEQGMRHPFKKAFALPDRTIGYEYVPGGSKASFSLNKGTNNCFPSENYDEHIFLCGKDKALVLSNDQQSGNRLVSFLGSVTTVQRGFIQGSMLDAIGLGDQMRKIEYGISEDVIEIWADKKV
ncbi:MAG TPA: hypothetical protein VJI96_01415 [Candidatus Andersenbacteria bacterium]|nr:hypothetical protein [Candidatus Andersenbacteria bacterium]